MDSSRENYFGRDLSCDKREFIAMNESDWKTRLQVAIDSDGRSRAAICEAAGLSRNYIGSIYTDGREPTVSKFITLCVALNVSPAYIISGVDATPE